MIDYNRYKSSLQGYDNISAHEADEKIQTTKCHFFETGKIEKNTGFRIRGGSINYQFLKEH